MRSTKSIKKQAPTKSVNKPENRSSFSADPVLASGPNVVTPGSLPPEQVDFAELEDGTLVETIEDPNAPASSLLAIYKTGQVRYAGTLECEHRVLVPIPRQDEIFRHVGLARGTQPYESPMSLMAGIVLVICNCIEIDINDAVLIAAFVISTWCIEQLPIAPYLALVGPPRSGKTTILQVLNLLCRRPLLTSDITSAAYYEVYNKLTLTLLVDETLTAGNKRALFHLLKTGTTRGSVTLRKGRSLKAFGPKAISWTELPNDSALNSRCVIIPTLETNRTDLLKLTDKRVLDTTDALRMQLLRYRLENYKSLSLPKIEGDERLHSRTRDLYQALALPLGRDPEVCKVLVDLFAEQQEINREPLSPASAAVVRVLYQYIHLYPMDGKCAIRVLTEAVNSQLERSGEALRVNAHETGRALTSLGITNRKRTSAGFVLCLDLKSRLRIHNVAHNHGIDQESQFRRKGFGDDCELCKNLRAPVLSLKRKGIAE